MRRYSIVSLLALAAIFTVAPATGGFAREISQPITVKKPPVLKPACNGPGVRCGATIADPKPQPKPKRVCNGPGIRCGVIIAQ
jgi:hypothetical protein